MQGNGVIKPTSDDLISDLMNVPNPFDPSTSAYTELAFVITEEATVTLRLFSLDGRLIWEQDKGQQNGTVSFPIYADAFNNRDGGEQRLAYGVYICEVTAKSETRSDKKYRKIAILRRSN